MISLAPQNISEAIIEEMTLLENLVISFLRLKTTSFSLYNNYETQIRNILEELGIGLEQYLHLPISVLSGQQKQIISTLMAIISGTKLLLLDEHVTLLEPKISKALMRYMVEKIESSKMTTLMTTGNFNDAIEYGDRLMILHHGKIAFDLSGNEKLSLTKDHLLRLFHSLEDEERC